MNLSLKTKEALIDGLNNAHKRGLFNLVPTLLRGNAYSHSIVQGKKLVVFLLVFTTASSHFSSSLRIPTQERGNEGKKRGCSISSD